MQLTYRQGLLRGQVHPTLHVSNFLVKNDDYVDILAEPTALLAVASHKTKNYLIQEHKSNGEAWGPLPQNVNCLLYWDIDKSSGLVTRGFTTGTFSYGINAPSNPSVGQHWFDLANDVMKVWDGTYWDEMIRVFAGVYNSTSPTVTHFQFTSQVNDFTSARGGYIYYDANHRGIKDPLTGTFLNTGDGLILQAGSLNLPVKPDASVVYLTSAEPIPTKSLVCVNSNGKLELASASAEKYAVGMVEDDSPVGTSTRLITNGIVYYEQWNFEPDDLGQPLYLGETGQFTFIPSTQYIGLVLLKNAILLAPASSIIIENVNVEGGGGGGEPTSAELRWCEWNTGCDQINLYSGNVDYLGIAAQSGNLEPGVRDGTDLDAIVSLKQPVFEGGWCGPTNTNEFIPLEDGNYLIDIEFGYSYTGPGGGPASASIPLNVFVSTNDRQDASGDHELSLDYVLYRNSESYAHKRVNRSGTCFLKGGVTYNVQYECDYVGYGNPFIAGHRRFNITKLSGGVEKPLT